MANSRQSATIFSPSSKRPTKRTRSSITEHSFQGIASSPRGGSVTYVSGTNCHPCVGSLNVSRNIHQLASFTFFPPSHSRGLFVFKRLRQFWSRLAADDLPMHSHASRESSEDTAGRSPVRRTGCLPALAGNTPHRRRFRLLRKCFSSRHCLRQTKP